MKDYHFPAAVTIPAAIGLVGVLWLLHRKSGSNEERNRSATALPKEKESTSSTEAEEQNKNIEAEGVTVFKRILPETLGHDLDSSELRSKESINVAVETSQVRPVLEKLDVGFDNNVGFVHDIVGVEVDLNQCGESGVLESSDITPCGESGIFGSVDITPCDESCIFDSSDITSCGESAIIQNSQDDCEKSIIPQTCQFDTLESLNVVHRQDGGLCSSQREYLEQQINVAMEDGLKEAHRKMSQPGNILKSSLQMLPDSETHDLPSRTDLFVDLKIAEVLNHKTETVGLETYVDSDQNHEADLRNKTPTVDLPSEGTTRDIKSLPLLKDMHVDCAPDTTSSRDIKSLPLLKDMHVDCAADTASSSEDDINGHAVLPELPESSSPGGSNSSSLLSLISTSVADFQSHVDICNQAGSDASPALTLKEDGPQNDFVSSSLPQESSAVGPESSPFSTTDSSSFRVPENTASKINRSSVSSIKSVSSDRDERRSTSGRWLPKASSSSIDSFGPEEIEAIWGLGSSMDYLDKELFFMDTDPVVLPLKTVGLLDQAKDLAIKQEDGEPLMPLLKVGDKAGVSGSLRGASFQSCSTAAGSFPDKSLSADSLAKSISPLGDNSSEGSNDSGRGGSEHDIIFHGGDALVQFDFNMPSEICGQFIGKHGKNINYLKGKTGAYVALTNSFLAPGFQVCQVSGTQAEVDEALSMIRQKFPLQDYPLLTMDPISIPAPAPLQSDSQIVFPEVMQLSLPEGVSVDVYVSAVVDAGQVFVQQPTHRSFMSLEKLAYFLNLVYTQDPNVPSVPLPIESGVICVCESEGFWYRAMIMSPEDENGDVQVKFVDYGGYMTVPVSALKQIRADFMNLPFQAVECFMANITPNQSEKLFSSEATQALSDMTQGKLLQCQVVARTEYGMPYIHLYQIDSESSSAVLINQALVNSRLVRWIEIL